MVPEEYHIVIFKSTYIVLNLNLSLYKSTFHELHESRILYSSGAII